MQTKVISSKVCVARVFDRFNIDYTSFISRVPNWIFNCLGELDLIQALHDTRLEIEVDSYKCVIPPQLREIVAIEYEGLRLNNIEQVNVTDETSGLLVHPIANYQYQNGYIVTNFEEGNIVIYGKILPVEWDNNLKLYFPLILENEDLLTAIDWYILKRLIERGHNVPNYSLRDNNEYTNPALAWDKYKRIVRNSVYHVGADERENISRTIRDFITNYNRWQSDKFNPYLITQQ